jgi:hypothetical protein
MTMSYSKISVSLLSWVILARSTSGRFIYGFYLLPNTNPSGPLASSFHKMRDNPCLGQYTLKSQEIRKQRGKMMENRRYGRERYDGSLRDFPATNPFPKKTNY